MNARVQTSTNWSASLPFWLIVPSLLASFLYTFGFTAWTFYLSLSDSAQLPSYDFVGLTAYFKLWASKRWNIAYVNLFFFSGFYVMGTIAVGLLLAILATGCGPTGPQRYEHWGSITFQGRPIPAGEIRFDPDLTGNDGPAGYAVIKNGQFACRK